MTKTFEKDLNEKLNSEKVPMYITQKGCSLTRKTFIETNWLFANYGNYHSDEEFQELLDKYSNLNDNYEKEVIRSSNLETSNLKLFAEGNGLLSDNAMLTEKVEDLKSQLQQQALPVVPECVGNMVEYAKKTKKSIRWFFTEDAYMFPEAMDWYAGSDKGLVDDIYAERQCSLINAFITGKYEIEKPQLFYLKHIDMSKRNSTNDVYLKKYIHANLTDDGEQRLSHSMVAKGGIPKVIDYKFTQQEIDSMQTGSYEKIEVAE